MSWGGCLLRALKADLFFRVLLFAKNPKTAARCLPMRRSTCTSSQSYEAHPPASQVCNQSPPVGDKPSLMTFSEVETVFHE